MLELHTQHSTAWSPIWRSPSRAAAQFFCLSGKVPFFGYDSSQTIVW